VNEVRRVPGKMNRLLLHVAERGSQPGTRVPPLLFVHGACLGAWCWEEHFLDYFGELGYYAVALDLRGHGASAGRDALQDATIDDFVNDVSAVATRFDRPPIVAGHSMGGLIVQRFASRNPASGVVLLAPSPIGGMRRYGWALVRARPLLFLRAWIARDMLKLYPDNRAVRHIMFSPGTPEGIVSRCRELLQPESWRACMEMNDPIAPPYIVACPMLVLGGELDETVPAEAVIETARAYRAAVHMVPAAGHNLMLEPAWRDVACFVDQWARANHE
jgi:pimeloyl-ACP methyl ester carboxylesterase